MLLALALKASGQEFRCAVTINSQKLFTTTQSFETTDKKIFDNMKEAIETFVNQRRWTNLMIEPQEQIDCGISLILTQRTSQTDFTAQLTIQMRRPVYNSTYTTGLFNYIEQGNFNFSYNESQPLDFDLTNFTSNLSSTLAYYCYIMLGVYFDSFGLGGGEPFYEQARGVVQAAENSGYTGWRSTEGSKSRYWFMENHTNALYVQLHEAYYNYHRLGLDMMTKNQEQARQAILSALLCLKQVHQQKPNLLSVQQFVDVKIQELVSIFTPAPPAEQKQVYDIVAAISPINTAKIKSFNQR